MTVEAWKSIFDVLAVVLLGLTFFAGAGVLITGNIINGRQTEKLRQFDSDLVSAKGDLAKQQERAANADAKVAGLEKDASDAKTAQQEVEMQLVTARKDVEAAKTQAETAKKTAEDERLTRLELEKTLAPREIWVKKYEDGTTSVDDLKRLGKIKVLLEYIPSDFESQRAARNLQFIFIKWAKWEVTLQPIRDGSSVKEGVTLETPRGHEWANPREEWQFADRAQLVQGWLLCNEWTTDWDFVDRADLSGHDLGIVVGLKPNTYFQPRAFKDAERGTAEVLQRFAPCANPNKPVVESFLMGSVIPGDPKK